MSDKPFLRASDIPDDAKPLIAGIYHYLHEHGVPRSQYLKALESSGYSIAPSTLDLWVSNLISTGTVIRQDKESGAEPLLGRESRDVTSGWVLHENSIGSLVSLESFQTFVFKYFNIELSESTISRYLNEDGFAVRLVNKKAKGFVVDVEGLRAELWNWVILQDFRSRNIRRDRFCSIDFTFTGHRTERQTTFAPRGGPQPMAAEKASNYTNCVVTCLWADGINRTPPVLFTYDPAFRTDRPPTKRRDAQLAHLRRCMDQYGITENRIIYIGTEKKEMKKYARECPDLIRRFFEIYQVPSDTTIFSDEGKSFIENGKSVLLNLGFAKHIKYPARVHQFISPNDNKAHGTAKQAWRTSRVDHSDDVMSCLCLLSYLDTHIVRYSKNWWDTNMICLTEDGVKDLIGQGPCKLSHLHKTWRRSYDDFMKDKMDIV